MSSLLAQRLEDYLAMRRALGFKLKTHGLLLEQFVAYLDGLGKTVITVELALTWATQPVHAAAAYWVDRLGAVRVFARHMASLDPRTEIPPMRLLPRASDRAVPYLYSDTEIAALLNATAQIPTPLVAATYRCLLGLLAVTGMRVSEAINLVRDDIDFDEGVLLVRNSKFGKSRELALHPSTVAALHKYAAARDSLCRRPATNAWFVSVRGTPLVYSNVRLKFLELAQHAGLTPRSDRDRHRIHDLRHAFAVSTLLTWYRTGVDVQAKLPLLSTYLGHTNPENTYWYLTGMPELMQLVAQRLGRIGSVD
jgi:integrase/recombinase XerD